MNVRTKTRPPRPRAPVPPARTVPISLRLPDNQLNRLRRVKETNGLSMQENIRRAIDAYLDNRNA